MYAIYTYIDPSNHPNVGICGIHGVSGNNMGTFGRSFFPFAAGRQATGDDLLHRMAPWNLEGGIFSEMGWRLQEQHIPMGPTFLSPRDSMSTIDGQVTQLLSSLRRSSRPLPI